jgi:predicted GNAT family acetyltransferase
MSQPDPLERPVWSALAGPQARFALIEAGARRMRPEFGLFAATADSSEQALAALGRLIAAHGETAVVEAAPPAPVPGTKVLAEAWAWQMTAEAGPEPGPPDSFEIVPLGEAEAVEMLALATLTRPGPFFARTHELGRFLGVKQAGRLVAMAGERLRLDGFTEVSGVCTHPDWRGRGYAAALMTRVADAIRARGETPVLHVYAQNRSAIGLYECLGFRFSRELVMTVLAPG